jgi:hypothetical protein
MLPDTIVKAIGSLPAVVRSGRRVNGLFHAQRTRQTTNGGTQSWKAGCAERCKSGSEGG